MRAGMKWCEITGVWKCVFTIFLTPIKKQKNICEI